MSKQAKTQVPPIVVSAEASSKANEVSARYQLAHDALTLAYEVGRNLIAESMKAELAKVFSEPGAVTQESK